MDRGLASDSRGLNPRGHGFSNLDESSKKIFPGWIDPSRSGGLPNTLERVTVWVLGTTLLPRSGGSKKRPLQVYLFPIFPVESEVIGTRGIALFSGEIAAVVLETRTLKAA